jgi:hypothetical protein
MPPGESLAQVLSVAALPGNLTEYENLRIFGSAVVLRVGACPCGGVSRPIEKAATLVMF